MEQKNKELNSINSQKIIKLTAPEFETEHIKEKIVCIRGHRERIFQVSVERVGEKFVFHNYGQGGAGWTFLFGCVNESLRQFQENKFENNPKIAIIGAGCYGLLTATILTRLGYQVTIYAKEIENIASNKSAGFFFPRARKCSTDVEREVFLKTGIESYQTYLQIISGNHEFIKSGPVILPAYYSLDIDPGFAPYIEKKLISEPEQVTIDFGNKNYQANEYKTIFINSAEIMRELWSNVRELQISVIQQEIKSFEELSEKIIFNCSGFGSRELAQDTRIVPVQGHLITLKNQKDLSQLQYMINFQVLSQDLKGRPRDELIYFAPRESGILGITFIRGEESLDANLHEFERLLQRCREFFY